MSRLSTVALVGALALLGAVAAIDALRSREPVRTGAPATGTSDTTVTRDALRDAEIQGTLLYTDDAECRLHAVELPELRPGTAARWETCAFALGPRGDVAPEGTVFQPDGPLESQEISGGVDVFDPTSDRGVRFENARAPSFRPSGTLTIVQRGRLVEQPPCGGRRLARAIGGCSNVLVTEDAITEALDLSRLRPQPRRIALVDVVWLSDSRLVALADAGTSDLVVHVDLGRSPLRPEVWLQSGTVQSISLSPRRTHLLAVTGEGKLVVLDEGGRLLSFGGRAIRSAAWSPDGRWIAILAGDGVTFVRPDSSSERVGPFLLGARDIAWK